VRRQTAEAITALRAAYEKPDHVPDRLCAEAVNQTIDWVRAEGWRHRFPPCTTRKGLGGRSGGRVGGRSVNLIPQALFHRGFRSSLHGQSWLIRSSRSSRSISAPYLAANRARR